MTEDAQRYLLARPARFDMGISEVFGNARLAAFGGLEEIALSVELVKAASFGEVARRAGIPPGTVSRRIQQLEAQLGLLLLHASLQFSVE